MNQKQSKPINAICQSCYGKCKQPASVQLISCPKHDPYPVQMELKLPGLKKTRKKRKAV
jgi:hypothetical protein